MKNKIIVFFIFLLLFGVGACKKTSQGEKLNILMGKPKANLIPSEKFIFKSFVDCNMATVWVKDTFRIFPGKYGEDPLWGESRELKYASGANIDEAFRRNPEEFTEPNMPKNSPPGKDGLHGAVWFEAIYKDIKDKSENTLYAIYHNENYPSTLPYDSITGKGYLEINWPQGLLGPDTKTAVCRIGIMKSVDGGLSWSNKGIVLEDLMPRLILKSNNTSINFAGGVGDPSAVVNGDYLYIFYGEYGYPGDYNANNYDPIYEWSGQCISVARIPLTEINKPVGKAKRWGGNVFDVDYDGIGTPIRTIQIPIEDGGGPTSSPTAKYFWGPSVSWNTYLNCWVMLMAKAEGPSWKGSSIYISFNKNEDLGEFNNSQEWSKPELLLNKPGHTIWYPSLQPFASENNKENKYTSVMLGKKARLFYKDIKDDNSPYLSDYIIEFEKDTIKKNETKSGK
jgi:hypothetical protein